MAGGLAGTDGWFNNPANQNSSAHYGVSLEGEVHQYVRLEDAAWANGVLEPGNTWPGQLGVNPNFLTCSVETEDLANPDEPVTDALYNAVLGTCRLILTRYPAITLLTKHTTISPRSRPGCPGRRWVGSGRYQRLAEALGLTAL